MTRANLPLPGFEPGKVAHLGYRIARRRRPVPQSGVCCVCNQPHEWYEETLATCSPATQEMMRLICVLCRAPYKSAIRRHHLNADWARRLILAGTCDLCGESLERDGTGRHRGVVDHDHHCCAMGNSGSCGQCVRGVLHPRCNMIVGKVEAIEGIDLVAVSAYLAPTPTPTPPLALPGGGVGGYALASMNIA